MKKINHIDAIRHPIITEKATILSEQNKTVFKVHEKANKKTIKKNIEKLFKVNVIKVNIINQKSKLKIKQGKKSITLNLCFDPPPICLDVILPLLFLPPVWCWPTVKGL